MTAIIDLETEQEFETLLRKSKEIPCFIIKHSTRCGISGGAYRSFSKFAETDPAAELYRLLVVENRSLSNHIAQETGIRHESPQVLLFRDGKVVWNESHWSIGKKSLAAALDKS